ncbi:uncharacterized protein PV06_03112 [Exophiala oligosperma]|uniref:Secreted protein n=1 Tax=Exophiala oligosperma TaxID=215243 RepID=A0A0D2C4E7_9EURO|nr:uncharacterized protein PV06_03112 [Exophiala oligosperma]KIW44657.1 hypothetical protein PV06_03112 [Exophiala oligosperma]
MTNCVITVSSGSLSLFSLSISLAHQDPEQDGTNHHTHPDHKADPTHGEAISRHTQTQEYKGQADQKHQPHSRTKYDNAKNDTPLSGGPTTGTSTPTFIAAGESVTDVISLKRQGHRGQGG